MLLTTIFYHVDNFYNALDKHLFHKNSSIGRPSSMSRSEILTI